MVPSRSPNSTDLYFWYLCQQTNTKDIAGQSARWYPASWVALFHSFWEGGGTEKVLLGGTRNVLLGGIMKVVLGGTKYQALCTYLQPSRWEQRCFTAGDHIGPTLVLHYDQPCPANVHKNIHLSTHDHINSTKPEIIWTQTPNILVGTSQSMFWSDKLAWYMQQACPGVTQQVWVIDQVSSGTLCLCAVLFLHPDILVSFCWCLSLAVWIILPLT